MFLRALIAAIGLWLAALPAVAQGFDDLLARLPQGSFNDRAAVVSALAATGDPRAEAVLDALAAGELHMRPSDGALLRVTGRGSNLRGVDVLSGEAVEVAPRSTEPVRVNNSLRRTVRAAMGVLTLRDPNPARRLSAAEAAFRAPDPEQLPAIDLALEAEEDARIRAALTQARAATILRSDAPLAERLEAVETIRARAPRVVISALSPYRAAAEPELAEAAGDAVAAAERTLRLWSQAQNVWFGLSLGSVLLLAAVGLAITFGVMGVINMAHGELVMLGAYTTFVVQNAIRVNAPHLFDWSLLIAAPLAFGVAGLVGVAIERGIVRHLYGRPLETLLATWGVSLILQQAVRSIFGPNNREVGNPSWMSGAFELGQLMITWNRLWILVFSLAIFAILLFVMRRTAIGLQMRAVTQNRAMAASMGIRTGWVDAMTFGLGAGIAGLAGVALSQIDNVSPNLGQNYIVDSFMVVVFGGAGNIWGTLAAAFSLGVANKFLEPYAGAVLAKILILVAIILFIQKRPRGLFAVRGRAVDA
ncbi:urea ABC transporter permease subunit UrtB [Halodurantibacterium flavum]|uniref:Urea ABC transporter permease subunit UrtB n=1 Tax=Halodurantibacterium flavum TaxID=1382802 RepID=A0ABW4S4F4_9RHOB